MEVMTIKEHIRVSVTISKIPEVLRELRGPYCTPALMSVSLAFSRTPAYGCRTTDTALVRYAAVPTCSLQLSLVVSTHLLHHGGMARLS